MNKNKLLYAQSLNWASYIFSYIIHGNTSHSAELRQLVVKELSNDILTYNEAFLGATNKAYCEMISDPDKWGGDAH